MNRKVYIETGDEEIESQIDRLNIAVHKLMIGIEVSAQTPRNPSQLSFAHPDWMDEDDDKSQDLMIPDHFERRLEEVLVQLDRCQMINEDFWADLTRKQQEPGSISEAYVLKLEKENMELRAKTNSITSSFSSNSNNGTKPEFILNIRKNPTLEHEKKNFEEKLLQLDKLNESYQKKHLQMIKVQESLRVKERWIDQKEKELKAHWQNFEKTKLEWEKTKNAPESLREIKHNRLIQSYDKSLFEIEVKPETQVKPEAPPPVTPVSRDQALKTLNSELQDLETQLKSTTEKTESQKLIMKIDSIKNRIATLRGQKALFESSRSSRLITHMMKTMEKEVNYEENKRKQQLEKFTNKKNPLRASVDFSKKEESPVVKQEVKEQPVARTGVHRLLDEKQVTEFRKQLLDKREKDLNNRELMLQETWMKVPGAKELIENVNLTLNRLTQQKHELDTEREIFEKEKVEMLRIRDKLKDQVGKISFNC